MIDPFKAPHRGTLIPSEREAAPSDTAAQIDRWAIPDGDAPTDPGHGLATRVQYVEWGLYLVAGAQVATLLAAFAAVWLAL